MKSAMVITSLGALTMMLAVTCLSGEAQAHSGATGVVKERMDNFKSSKRTIKAIRSALRAGELNQVADGAVKLAAWSAQLPDLFPPGSNQPPSEARPEIWQEFDRFTTYNQEFGAAAEQLAAAASSGDKDAADALFVELAESCDRCHDRYKE